MTAATASSMLPALITVQPLRLPSAATSVTPWLLTTFDGPGGAPGSIMRSPVAAAHPRNAARTCSCATGEAGMPPP